MPTITSDPKPSHRLQGWDYAYYDKQTANGKSCVVVFSPALRGYVKQGFVFEESSVHYDPALGASVLELDFHEPPDMEEPAVPPQPETGWGDPDRLLAHGRVADPASDPRLNSQPPSPRAVRDERAAAIEAARSSGQVAPGLISVVQEISAIYCLHYRLLSPLLPEQHRALVAQKLTATTAIPWYRAKGVNLSEQDVASMSF